MPLNVSSPSLSIVIDEDHLIKSTFNLHNHKLDQIKCILSYEIYNIVIISFGKIIILLLSLFIVYSIFDLVYLLNSI